MYNLPIDPVRSKYNACTGCTVTAIKSYIIKCVSAVAFVTLHIHGIFRYFFVWCYGTNLFEKNQELDSIRDLHNVRIKQKHNVKKIFIENWKSDSI